MLTRRFFYGLVAAAAVLVSAFIGYHAMRPAVDEQTIVKPERQPSPDSIEEERLDNNEPSEDGEETIAVIDGEIPDEISEDGVTYHDF